MRPNENVKADCSLVRQSFEEHAIFAEPTPVLDRLRDTYLFNLDIVEASLTNTGLGEFLKRLPVAAQDRVLHLTPLRGAIDDLLAHLKGVRTADLQESKALFEFASSRRHADIASDPWLGSFCEEVIFNEARLPLWSHPQRETPFTNAFTATFESKLAFDNMEAIVELVSLDCHQKRLLTEAAALLSQHMPTLCSHLAPHVGLVAFVGVPRSPEGERPQSPFESVFLDSMPGTVVISEKPFLSQIMLAESLLHESLHQKLHDLITSHEIFAPGYVLGTEVHVEASWKRERANDSQHWPLDRALFAFHVYAYLAYFSFLLSKSRDPFKEVLGATHDANASFAIASARAVYLGEEILRTSAQLLGRDGLAFVKHFLDSVRMMTSGSESMFEHLGQQEPSALLELG